MSLDRGAIERAYGDAIWRLISLLLEASSVWAMWS